MYCSAFMCFVVTSSREMDSGCVANKFTVSTDTRTAQRLINEEDLQQIERDTAKSCDGKHPEALPKTIHPLQLLYVHRTPPSNSVNWMGPDSQFYLRSSSAQGEEHIRAKGGEGASSCTDTDCSHTGTSDPSGPRPRPSLQEEKHSVFRV